MENAFSQRRQYHNQALFDELYATVICKTLMESQAHSNGQDHSHSHSHSHGHSLREQSSSKMRVVLTVTLLYMVVQVVTGLSTGSLALLADAGHLLTDIGS